MAKVVAGNSTFNITSSAKELLVDDAISEHSLVKNPDGSFHMLVGNISYTIELLDKNTSQGELTLRVNGRKLKTKLHNKLAVLLDSMGMETGKKKVKDLKAPMPGLVLDVLVQEGSEVQEGEDLLILEAMKMENAIKSPQAGTIESISIQIGDKVEKNQALISFQ